MECVHEWMGPPWADIEEQHVCALDEGHDGRHLCRCGEEEDR